jgi:hypothetical protein
VRPYLVELGRFFTFLIYTQSVGHSGRGSARRKAATYTKIKRTETLMHRVGFEPTILVFERAKTVHASDRAATVISACITWIMLKYFASAASTLLHVYSS